MVRLSPDSLSWWLLIGVAVPATAFVSYLLFDAVRSYVLRRRCRRNR
jgi:hypothetical protein